MAIDIEDKIESAWIAIIEANTYISDNSIPVRRYHDNTEDINSDIAVIVNVNPVTQQFPSSTLWESSVELMAVTYLIDDKDQGKLKLLYKQVLEIATNTTMSELTVAGDITFNGTTQLDPNEKMYDEEGRFQTIITNIKCHVQT